MSEAATDHAPADVFARFAPTDVRALIEQFPLAWVVSPGTGAASQLPLVGVFDADDRLTRLIGHFSRGNPLHRALADDPRAMILFNGPQGYVGTDKALDPRWAPTWNMAHARIAADITLEPEATGHALQVLLDAMEGDMVPRWTTDALGERYRAMVQRIIGFTARVVSLEGRFKLGQDEDLATLRSIIEKTDDADLAEWMRRFNRERLVDA